MAEEPRRSGRATKGVNTKERDIPEDAAPKRKGKSKAPKLDANGTLINDDGDKIRCVCGEYEEEEDEPRDMICCDKCDVWQHNECMGLPAKFQPKSYFCEKCRPENHKSLLEAMARGEKPWEEIVNKHQSAAAPDTVKGKTKGKKVRKSGGRPSDAQSHGSRDTATPQKETPVPSGQKRKLAEPDDAVLQASEQTHSSKQTLTEIKKSKKPRQTPIEASPVTTQDVDAPTPQRKPGAVTAPIRKASQTEGNQLALVSSVSELENEARRKSADALVKLFVEVANAAKKDGSYSLPSNRTFTDVGNDIGLRLEHALYIQLSGGSGEISQQYKEQLKSIRFNVKKNNALRDRVLNGSLSPAGLAILKPAEMASKELQERDEQIKREAEKQHMIIQEQAPRIRRTHKGEEYIDEDHQVAEESSNMQRRPSMIQDDFGDRKSPGPIEDDSQEAPLSPVRRQKPARIDTQAPPRPSAGPERKSSTNFNIQNVWSSVQGSPDADRPHFAPPPRQLSSQRPSPTGPGAQADEEIDALLKDDAPESPPYSPKDYPEDPDTIWKGAIEMMPIAEFRASAKFAAGAMPPVMEGLDFKWSQMIPQKLSIDGRIKHKVADEYVCGLKYSHTTDVVIISISPQNDADRPHFDALFEYFTSRERFGVGQAHPNAAVKDIYLIPIEKGQTPDKQAEFLHLLDSPFLAEIASERMFLATFVVKLLELTGQQNNIASPSATPQETPAPVQASPIVDLANTSTLSHRSTVVAPIGNGYSPPPPPPPYGQPSRYSPPQPQMPPDGQPQPLQNIPNAMIAAAQVLGPMKDAPAVQQLLMQVPNAGINEMNVVKGIIQERPQAAEDLSLLHQMLLAKHQP